MILTFHCDIIILDKRKGDDVSMKLFLCGGGEAAQTIEAYIKLNEIIDHSKPCLYVPLAMEEQMYDSCYNWIKGELKNVDVPYIEMVRNANESINKNFENYSMIFIGGGNTFKLLSELKASGAFNKIKEYLSREGVVFGASAGAIIFGEDLESCMLDDANEVKLTETSGFDILNGISILCHYTNRTFEKDTQSKNYLLELSKRRKVIALPEEVTLFVNDDTIEVIGNKPYYYFGNGIVSEKYN